MNQPGFHVRRAGLGDLEELVAFTRAEFREAERTPEAPDSIRHGVKAALDDDTLRLYWVLINNDFLVIGNASVVKEWSEWHAGYYWWIQSMYIQPEYRGKGLMEKLLCVVKTAAKDKGALDLRLYVHKLNARAIKAYRKSGFSDSDYQIMKMEL